MWVIPVDQKDSSHISLKPYNESGYLTCKQSKAVVCEGDSDNVDSDNEFRVDDDKCLASKPTL